MALSQSSYNKIQALLMRNTPVDIYKMVLSGELSRFPNGFWDMPDRYRYANECLSYLIEEVLGYEIRSEEFKQFIKDVDTIEFFKEYKLLTMYTRLFIVSKHAMPLSDYENIYNVWEVVGIVPKDYGESKENWVNVVKWLFEYKNGIDIESLSQQGIVKIPKSLMSGSSLQNLISSKFQTPKKLLQEVYPKANMDNILISDNYQEISYENTSGVCKQIIKKEYEVPNHFWNSKEVRKLCMKYFVEEILKIEDINEEYYKISFKNMIENKLGSLLDKYGWDISKLLKEVYPELKVEELQVSLNRDSDRRKVIKDVLGEDTQVLECKTLGEIRRILKDNNMLGLVGYYGGVLNLLSDVYDIKPWQFRVPEGYWNSKENRTNAIKWVLEYKNNIDVESLSQKCIVKIPKSLFIENGLQTLISSRFKTPKPLLKEAYPKANINNILISDNYEEISYETIIDVYKKIIQKECEVPNHFWDSKEVREVCVKYFVEDILQIKDISKEAYKISNRSMIENGLVSLLDKPEWDRYKIIKEVYPELEEWQISLKRGRWKCKENRHKAIKDVLGEDIKSIENKTLGELRQILRNNGLLGLKNYYGGLQGLLTDVYGVKPWQFRVPNGYWDNTENVRYAIKWFIEEQLKGDYEVLKNKGIKWLLEYMRNYGLEGMVSKNKLNGNRIIELYEEMNN